MRCHYLALSIVVFIMSIGYAVPLTWNSSPFKLVPELRGPDWDLLVFTQQWPVTVCRKWKDRNPNHKCSLPDDPNAWSIHGIWPTKLHTMGPSFCNETWHFDHKLIQPIEKELNSSWRNIESETSTYALWAHEWSKHGTCAAVLEAFNSELKYFSKGLEWFKTYNMKTELESHEVYPSNTKQYLVKDLFNMINMHYKVTPIIECWREHGINWLSEIRFCFDKNLDLKDCDGVMNMRTQTIKIIDAAAFFNRNTSEIEFRDDAYIRVLTNCIIDEPILYPKSEDAFPNELYVQFYLLISWLQWFTF